MGNGGIAPQFLISTRDGSECSRYPLRRRLGEPQGRSGRCGENTYLALPGIEPWLTSPSLYRLSCCDSCTSYDLPRSNLFTRFYSSVSFCNVCSWSSPRARCPTQQILIRSVEIVGGSSDTYTTNTILSLHSDLYYEVMIQNMKVNFTTADGHV
jgi:hypothetical protein